MLQTNGLTNNQITTLPKALFRAKLYARVSTISQADDNKYSLEEQEDWARKLCQEKEWEFAGVISDTLVGDTEYENRPGGTSLLEDAKLKLFNLVLFYHSSRNARETWIGMKMISDLGRLGVQTYIKNAPIEPVPQDKFIYGANIGAEYVQALSLIGDKQENFARSERVTFGFKNLAQLGVLVFAPYGYKKIKEFKNINGKDKTVWRFEEDPVKTAVVRRIFNTYLKGDSLRGVAKGLIKDNTPSPSGKLGLESWTPATVKNILSNPAYIGQVRWGRKLGSKFRQLRSVTGKQKRVLTNKLDWVISDGSNFSRIIDKATFIKVQERIKKRGKIAGTQLASKSLLTGLVYCSDCNRRANCKSRKIKRPNGEIYYKSDFIDQSYFRGNSCRRHLIAAAKLEHLVLAKLQARLYELKETDIEKELSFQDQKSEDLIQNSMRQINIQLRSYKSKQDRLVNGYIEGFIGEEEYKQQKEKLALEQTSLDQEKTGLQGLLEDQSKKIKALETLRQVLTMFSSVTDPLVKKEMIQGIIEKVVIYKTQVEIVYKYPSEGSDGLNVKPHPCGYFGDQVKACICLPTQVSKYQKRLSGPILDRIDIFVDVPAVKTKDLVNLPLGEASKDIRGRVQKARDSQQKRFTSKPIVSNSEMSSKEVKEFCNLEEESKQLLAAAINKFQISARGYGRILKVARTIADLAESEEIKSSHIAEAIQYRVKDN